MTRHGTQFQLLWGHKTPQIESRLHDLIPWLTHAGRPYFDVFFEGVSPEDTLTRWMQRSSSEFALQRTRFLIDDQVIVGGYISLAGRDLAGCRQADLLDLARTMGESSYSTLRTRMNDLKDLFVPVEENDFYLSYLGLLPEKESPRRQQALLNDCLRRARQGGFGRLRVDVPEQSPQRDFYAGQGFNVAYRGKSRSSNLKYLTMVYSLR